MASRKSIAKVQLGSLTPDKAAMASGQGTSAIDQAGVHLPQINANHPSENGEVRSMDNLIAKAAVRTSRQSVINKKVSSESAKGPSSNPPSVAERTARPSIINSHSRNDGRSDQSTSETAAVKRESRPSVIGKHSGGKVSNEGNRVALTPRDISFEESTSSDSSHKVVAVAVNEVRREAEPVAKLSSKLVDAGRSDLSPSAPSQPMASHRTQRNTIIKQSPVKITATKASDANATRLPFIKATAQKICAAVLSAGMKTASEIHRPDKRIEDSRGLTREIQNIARDFISVSIHNALHKMKGF